jgi:hypothetical protein
VADEIVIRAALKSGLNRRIFSYACA